MPASASPSLSSYQAIANRIRFLLSSPAIQVSKRLTVARLDHECPREWDRLLDEIADTEGVELAKEDDGSATIRWTNATD
ncbi:DUF1654 domain-containing protein [Pseudomonas sp. LTJR-52]|uniref:DUF1654 domain-containing protein n=1 Tax=Pseudomonas sp. LTJR-52 TaxID=2479392 RepID=UPI000EFB2099|nr:DUF1654 domain-containing protein [Pseudomonas sp. LTJR-52]AYN94398.1 DUF1654 domain-containing protein [Pseudomonas sp. LTJR-52]